MANDTVVAYRPAAVEMVGGDVLAALMLSQIGYYHRVSDKTGRPRLNSYRYGKWWLAKSHVDWTNELGMTQMQSRRCLGRLRSLGIVTTKQMMYRGKQMVHLRLIRLPGIDEALGLSEHLDVLPATPSGVTDNTSYNKSKNESKGKSLEPVPATQAPSAGQEPDGEEHSEEPTPETNQTEEKPADELGDVVCMNAPKKAGPLKASKTDKDSALVSLWKVKLHQKYGGPTVQSISGADAQKLKLLYNKLNGDTGPVTAWAINHWPTFVGTVNMQRGSTGGPLKPVPGYLLTYADTADALWAKQGLPQVQAVAWVSPKPKIDKSHLYEKEVPASHEEVLAAMKEMGLFSEDGSLLEDHT